MNQYKMINLHLYAWGTTLMGMNSCPSMCSHLKKTKQSNIKQFSMIVPTGNRVTGPRVISYSTW